MSVRMKRVHWLYKNAYDSANEQGVYSVATTTFLNELRATHMQAYRRCVQDIACYIIGG